MRIKYICRECSQEHDRVKVCDLCWWPVKKNLFADKENPMNKEKALKFLKSQQYKHWNHNKIIFEKYKNIIDLLNIAIPDKKQDKLF